jgi:hypothetical protein
MRLLDVISIGSIWRSDEDLGRVEIVSIDYGTDYPVLFRWKDDRTEGRDTARGFINAFIPDGGWADLLECLDC